MELLASIGSDQNAPFEVTEGRTDEPSILPPAILNLNLSPTEKGT